jgi:hypothetical protein
MVRPDHDISPCDAMAYHGFNGLEADVVSKITAWMRAAQP